MYQPPFFRETDTGVLHELIRAHPLGLLISGGADGLLANPLPFLLDGERGDNGVLRLHMARANPQWKTIAAEPDAPVLAVFQGANSYVTPSFYASKREHGKVVPTWNYAIVEIRGRATVFDDADWLARQIADLTRAHEGKREKPWAVTDAPADFIRMQIRAIVGMEIEISSIEGKWKVSQNRPEPDRIGVAQGLDAEPDSAEMAALVRRYGKIDG